MSMTKDTGELLSELSHGLAAKLDQKYTCPGDAEDGGEHIWMTNLVDWEVEKLPDGRVWCPDHGPKEQEK